MKGQTEIANRLTELTEQMAKGNISDAKLNEYKILWCKQIVVNMTVKSGNDLMTLEKAALISMLDAICELLFYGQWESNPPEVTPDDVSQEVEEAS